LCPLVPDEFPHLSGFLRITSVDYNDCFSVEEKLEIWFGLYTKR
jgi:hypothetical protein